MLNIKFRNAGEEDFVKFNEIYVKTTFLGNRILEQIKPKSFEDFMMLVENEEIILMEDSENIIGYAIVKAYDDGECVIEDIYILEEFQNRGLGRQFVNYIERTAKETGMEFISLMSATSETDRVWEVFGYVSVNYSDEYRKNL